MNRIVSAVRCAVSQSAIICRHPRRSIGVGSHQTSQQLHFISRTEVGSKMLQSNRLKHVFSEAQRPAMGFWQMLPGANISRILARSGADWVMVDCEHGNIDGRRPCRSLCDPHGVPTSHSNILVRLHC